MIRPSSVVDQRIVFMQNRESLDLVGNIFVGSFFSLALCCVSDWVLRGACYKILFILFGVWTNIKT